MTPAPPTPQVDLPRETHNKEYSMKADFGSFGLRDFLHYVVPGSCLLGGALLLMDVPTASFTEHEIIMSILGAVAAFVVGQISYVVTYAARSVARWLIKIDTTTSDFKTAYMVCIEDHPRFSTEIIRYRSFARFCAAMVIPTGLLGVAAFVRMYAWSPTWAFVTACTALLGCFGFAGRYRRYQSVYHDYVWRCYKHYHEQASAATHTNQTSPNP